MGLSKQEIFHSSKLKRRSQNRKFKILGKTNSLLHRTSLQTKRPCGAQGAGLSAVPKAGSL